MRQVVFLRNVNQGQRGHPSTADILSAFADAGYPDAATYRSNGTVVVNAEIDDEGVADVVAALAVRSGEKRSALRLPMAELSAIVRRFGDEPARRELTVHAAGAVAADDPRLRSDAERWGCRVLGAGDGWVVSAHDRDEGVSATPALEQLTGMPATSRGLRTIVGLVNRFGD